MQVVEFTAYTNIVVIGQNPEMADYDNPKGNLDGYAAYVQAVSEQGDTRILCIGVSRWESDILPKAIAQADALNVRLAMGKLPVNFDAWREGYPIYGSQAYLTA
jgi:hypothetical protein